MVHIQATQIYKPNAQINTTNIDNYQPSPNNPLPLNLTCGDKVHYQKNTIHPEPLEMYNHYNPLNGTADSNL